MIHDEGNGFVSIWEWKSGSPVGVTHRSGSLDTVFPKENGTSIRYPVSSNRRSTLMLRRGDFGDGMEQGIEPQTL